MKLSEAIRLGSMLGPQGFGVMSSFVTSNERCALAAANAAGLTGLRFADAIRVKATYPCAVIECQYSGVINKPSLGDVIVHLNDHHRWTRERIAEFVETIERQIENAQTSAPEPTLAALRRG